MKNLKNGKFSKRWTGFYDLFYVLLGLEARPIEGNLSTSLQWLDVVVTEKSRGYLKPDNHSGADCRQRPLRDHVSRKMGFVAPSQPRHFDIILSLT